MSGKLLKSKGEEINTLNDIIKLEEEDDLGLLLDDDDVDQLLLNYD